MPHSDIALHGTHAPVPPTLAPPTRTPIARPVLPDDEATRAIERFIEALRARVLRQHLCEALLAGAGAALLLTLVLLRHASSATIIGSALAAALASAVGWSLYRASARREAEIVTQAEAGHPALRNLLVTERELAREPDRATPRIRARVRQDAARVVSEADPAVIIPTAQLARPAIAALALIAIAAGVLVLRDRTTLFTTAADALRAATGAATDTPGSSSNTPVTGGIGTITITVTPPAYAGRTANTQTNPTSVTVLAGSTLTIAVDADAPLVETDFAGTRQPLARATVSAASSAASSSGAARFSGSLVAQETGVLTLTASNGDPARPVELARRIVAVAVTPDQPPTVRLTAPAKDLLFPDNSARLTFQADATDDIGLGTLTLHYTKVSGSGERYEFTEGELPFTVTRQDARSWRAETARTLASLEINEGDTFVYYAAATDHRPDQPRAVSDSFVIEIGKGGLAIAGGFAIPPDEEQFAISLNALIQKTEKLHARRDAMARAAFAEAALGLAIEQRMVRSEFLFSMGSHGHVQDEEEEAEHSDEIQAGRLANRGQAELAEATRQMTRAEQHLTDAETAPALTAQRAALAAVQRAMSRQRYFLRTLAVGGTIDPTRRLTGDLAMAKPGARPDAAAVDMTRASQLRAVLQSIAALQARVTQASAQATSSEAVSAQMDSVRTGPAQPGSARAGSAQTDAAQATSTQAASTQAGSARTGPAQPGSARAGSAHAGSARTDAAQTASARPAGDSRGSSTTVAGVGAARGRSAGDDARLVAGQLLALDPASAALRGASQQLLDAARALDAGDAAKAHPLLQQATDALLPLVRAASAPASGAPRGGDRQLTGARLDALRSRGGAR